MNVLNIGQQVLLTVNSYSDYSIKGVFVVMKEFDMEMLIDKWFEDGNSLLRKRGVKLYNVLPGKPEFTEWAVSEGYLNRLKVIEFNLGDIQFDETTFSEGHLL